MALSRTAATVSRYFCGIKNTHSYTHPHKHTHRYTKQAQIKQAQQTKHIPQRRKSTNTHKQLTCFSLCGSCLMWGPNAPSQTSLGSSCLWYGCLKFQHYGQYFSTTARGSQGSARGPFRETEWLQRGLNGRLLHTWRGGRHVRTTELRVLSLKVNKLLVSFVSPKRINSSRKNPPYLFSILTCALVGGKPTQQVKIAQNVNICKANK